MLSNNAEVSKSLFLIGVIKSLMIESEESTHKYKAYSIPVRVAKSMMVSTPSLSAYTNASARVSLPSASVLRTSIVLPFEATKMSPGLMASADIMFSQTAVMK